MPPITPPRGPSGPPRRSLLAGVLGAGAAASLLSACSEDSASAARGAEKPEATEDRLRERSARESRDLLLRYDATLAAHPALAALLGPLRAETALHAEAFGTARSTGSPPATPPAPPAGTAPVVPRGGKKALTALADAERHTADRRTGSLTDASPGLARLLASVAASGAVHAYLLTEDA